MWLTVDLVEMDGEHVGPIPDPFLGAKTVEGVGARVDELVRATGHAQATASALVGPEREPSPAQGYAVRPDESPSQPVAVQDAFGPVRGRRQWAGRCHQREEFAQVVLLSGQVHLTQGGAVVRLHLGPCDGPPSKRLFRERHDLGAPDVRETSISPRDHRRVGRSTRLDPGQLPGIAEGKVRSEGPLLWQSSTTGRYRLATDALDVGRRPPLLVGGCEPVQGRPEILFEHAPHVDDGDLLCRISRQGQGGPRRRGTGSDDQRCWHGGLRWSQNRAPSSPPPAGNQGAPRSASYSRDSTSGPNISCVGPLSSALIA